MPIGIAAQGRRNGRRPEFSVGHPELVICEEREFKMSIKYFTLYISLFALGLFIAMLFLLEIGRRMGIRRTAMDPEGARVPLTAIEGGIFALLGLLIAFSFSGAASRFDHRRHLCSEEANAIGTAYLRLDLLQGQARERLRADFRRYVETRLAAHRKIPDVEAAWQEFGRAMAIQREIWKQAVLACRDEGSQSATMLLLPALNQMIDITATRVTAIKTHPPLLIFAMLSVLALLSALVAGYGMARSKKRFWMHAVGFAIIMAFTIYVILDLETPNLGLVRVDANRFLVDLLQSMK